MKEHLVRHGSKHKIQSAYNKKKQTATKTKTKSYAFPKQETTRNQRKIIGVGDYEGVPLVEFVYLVFTRMSGESHHAETTQVFAVVLV